MPDASAGQPLGGGENEARFESLHTLYARRLRAYIAARLGVRFHLTDDLAQDTWIEVWRSLHLLRADETETFGWLASVARRVITHHVRRERSREVAVDFGGPHARLLAKAPAAEDVAMARATTRAVVEVLVRTSALGVAA
ncbi:RNA polymerase sigma factor [Streptomyces marispadix]|uniref:Sigma-70 family RNA polymerase sigma factor n=1 Tax=Streptomyces marispadix TaxID=2922868 RepID=A0ABS9T0G7_9ACTN|nr:sigma-70 family RNA polymerase sigma factor [Streptomyces marispadix]MCH6162029.1 sigma-70 family RNA polymerase sigma factor [Streptomyces marispadix]